MFLVPPPVVDISFNRTGPLYVGTGISLTCTVTLDMSVNSNEVVTIEWSRIEEVDENPLSNTMKLSDTKYSSNLIISPLTTGHTGALTCNATVEGRSKNSNSSEAMLNIKGKKIFYSVSMIVHIFCRASNATSYCVWCHCW